MYLCQQAMGSPGKEKYNSAQMRMAVFAKALAHPARIAILQYMLQAEDKCVSGEITAMLPLSHSTLLQHLRNLKYAGIIKGRITGTNSSFCINEKVWKEAEELFTSIFESYRLTQDQLC